MLVEMMWGECDVEKNFWGIILNREEMGIGCKVQVRAEEE